MIQVRNVTAQEDLDKVFEIRRIVFVGEQNCPPELEWKTKIFRIIFLATYNDTSAGACRWRKTDYGYKLERFCVLKDFRGKGIAQKMVQTVLDNLPADADYIYLNAQLDAMPLYSKFNFIAEGPQFEEAGIQHFKMVLKQA